MASNPHANPSLIDRARWGTEAAAAVIELRSGGGLVFECLATGAIAAIRSPDVPVSLYQGDALEGSPANLYLRLRDGESIAAWTPLLGAHAAGSVSVTTAGLQSHGVFRGVGYRLTLALGSTTDWAWEIQLSSPDRSVCCDLICVHDLGMSNAGNEAYISQYVDYTILDEAPFGPVVCARQNMAQRGGNPWTMLACTTGAVSYATDGLDLYGLSCRQTGCPGALEASVLPGRRRQGEFSLAALQSAPVDLAPGDRGVVRFAGLFLPDHPDPSSNLDLALLPAPAKPAATADVPLGAGARPATISASVASLFARSIPARSDSLTDAETTRLWPGPRRQPEHGDDGRLLSFFTDDGRHVVMQAKELLQERRTGAILRSGAEPLSDLEVLSLTATMEGVFASHVAVGNLSFHIGLSIRRDPLGVLQNGGLRIWAWRDDAWSLLGLPAAFEAAVNGCRWVYRFGTDALEVRVWTETDRHIAHLELKSSRPQRYRLAMGVVMGPSGTRPDLREVTEMRPDRIRLVPCPGTRFAATHPDAHLDIIPRGTDWVQDLGGDGRLFPDGYSRGAPVLVLDTTETDTFGLSFAGALDTGVPVDPGESPDYDAATAAGFAAVSTLTGGLRLHAPDDDVDRLAAMLPWLAHNATIHMSAAHGLEQYLGAAWGTRDVCQGPSEFLLALGRSDDVRTILCTVFANQHADGHWPQWFMYDRHGDIRAGEAHGDVVFWPLLALSDYVAATGDTALLAEPVPYHDDPGRIEPIGDHVSQARQHIEAQFVPGTALVAYGHGDWNDSLQPADPQLAARMVSSWTVQLSYQTLRALEVLWAASGDAARARTCGALAERIRAEFRTTLLRDDVTCGFAVLEDEAGSIRPLLHPDDSETGIHYRLLPLVRGILSETFTPAEARTHAGLIADHLLCPDGARLMDRPPRYRGGRMRIFQRGETSTFFGREIGIMYVHAHIRYCQAMALLGCPDALWEGLMKVVPPGIRNSVSSAALRQANCYFSSSDAAFLDRYQADREYDRVHTGDIAVNGGWRIYSSGSGLLVSLLVRHALGLRSQDGALLLDPVLPKRLNGLRVTRQFHGHDLALHYRVTGRGFGPRTITVNGSAVSGCPQPNPYRPGGVIIAEAVLKASLRNGVNQIGVEI